MPRKIKSKGYVPKMPVADQASLFGEAQRDVLGTPLFSNQPMRVELEVFNPPTVIPKNQLALLPELAPTRITFGQTTANNKQ